jgi:hypothetical protein
MGIEHTVTLHRSDALQRIREGLSNFRGFSQAKLTPIINFITPESEVTFKVMADQVYSTLRENGLGDACQMKRSTALLLLQDGVDRLDSMDNDELEMWVYALRDTIFENYNVVDDIVEIEA